MRQRVNRSLRDRPALSAEQWFEQFWQPHAITQPLANFVYTRMQSYSGIEFAKVHPDDRLNEDLNLSTVCWFDWQVSFCDDFSECFGVDVSDRFDPQNYTTVKELVVFLNYQLLSVNHS